MRPGDVDRPRSGLTATGAVVCTCCTYEVAAILSQRVPTISQMCKQHRWAEVVIVGWLLIHLHRKEAMCRT